MLFQNDPRDLDSWFDRPLPRSSSARTMAMDAYRRGTDVWVHVDMPGVAVESIDIDVEGNVVTVSGERTFPVLEDDQLYVNERPQGSFRRQVHLGDGLDSTAIEADLEDGVLTLRIPVAEKATARKIEVTSSKPSIDDGPTEV